MNNRKSLIVFFMSKKCLSLIILLCLIGISNAHAQYTQTARVLTGNALIGGFYEALPLEYATNTATRYPLIIFLHGLGEEGNGTTQLSTVLRNGPPKLLNNGSFPKSFTVGGQTFSPIVISPQCNGVAYKEAIKQLVDYCKATYRVDESRIYFTGLSNGGRGVWEVVSSNDEMAKIWAAIVPVCGASDPQWNLNGPKVIARNNIPVWALHNDMDPTVNVMFTINWVKLINEYVPAPTPPARQTIFTSNSHDAWSKAYDPNYKENGMNVYEWMLQYKSGTIVTPPPPPPPPPPGNKKITLTKNFGNGISYPNAMSSLNINPGDTLCIPAGDYSTLLLGNITGTAEKPVVITNCGGLVRFGINNTANGGTITVSLSTCKFIEFSGSGQPGLEYGFDIKASNNNGDQQFGIYMGNGSSDFDVHNAYIHDAGIFIVAKTTQECTNSEFWEGNYVMRNVKIHHIKGRNSLWEGFYIGNSHYILDLPCGAIKSHHIENIDVYDNDLENMTQDGIQLSMADLGSNKVRNNRVVNFGLAKNPQHSYGVLIGGGSTLDVSGNYISNGFAAGVCHFGSGVSRIFNNVIANTEQEGILVADRTVFKPATAYIYNNTILNTKDHVITIYATTTAIEHKLYNNLTVNAGTIYDAPLPGYYVKGDVAIPFSQSNNINYKSIAEAGFVDAASGNYRLTPTSTAINAGRDMADQGLATDLEGTARPQQAKFDVGAYESNLSAPTNIPPQAKAGNDVTIQLPASSLQLDGSASVDTDGSIVSYAWKKISGPGVGNITTADAAKTTVTDLTTAGAYVFELTVKDNSGAISTDQVTVTVSNANNKAPVANAGADINITLPVSSASLDGSISADSDGTIATYLWTKVSGPAAGTIVSSGTAKTDVTGLTTAGEYVYELYIKDNAGATATDQVKVIVASSTNKPPVASAGNNTTITLPVNSVQLDASASTDQDGTITSYSWRKLGGPAGGNITVTNASKTTVTGYTLGGNYVYEITVTDNLGATSSSNVTITVLAGISNKPPVARVNNDIEITMPASTATLDGGASSDEDGTIVSYSWKKITGSPGGNIITSTAARTEINDLYILGEYIYELTVTDNNNATSKAQVKIIVNSATNKVPSAKVNNDITITLPANSTSLNGSASVDEDGTIVSYKWEKVSGPGAGKIGTPNASSTAITELTIAGLYVFQLTVTDNGNASATALVNVTVLPVIVPENKLPVAATQGDLTIKLPENTVAVNGKASTDQDGTIISYNWIQITGPNNSNILDAQKSQTALTNLVNGEYVFQLTVTDDKGGQGISTFKVTVLAAGNVNKTDTVSLTPNPAIDFVRLAIDQKGTYKVNIQIYDLNGRLVKQFSANFIDHLQEDLAIRELQPGYYIVHVIGSPAFKWSGKFIKVGH